MVGVGSIFPVDIELSETVGDLKKKIKEKKPDLIYFNAGSMRLYLAREGGRWLNTQEEDIKSLKKGKMPDRIETLMTEELLLDEAGVWPQRRCILRQDF